MIIELTTGAAFLISSQYAAGPTAPMILAQISNLVVVRAAQAQTIETGPSPSTSTPMIASVDPGSQSAAIEAYLRKAYADEPILVDIARCESNFRQYGTDGKAIRGTVNKRDVGVMQINEKFQGPQAKALGLDIYSVEGNVTYAKHLYKKEGTAPWISSAKCWAGDLAKN
ncbi:MAG: hypothetical protein QOG91_51 [Candidatus Parcubacteria bacterium]|jgi:hypothetical protein|nr:hypothetical protein [Candidatus Parcubacteria bacterium]